MHLSCTQSFKHTHSIQYKIWWLTHKYRETFFLRHAYVSRFVWKCVLGKNGTQTAMEGREKKKERKKKGGIEYWLFSRLKMPFSVFLSPSNMYVGMRKNFPFTAFEDKTKYGPRRAENHFHHHHLLLRHYYYHRFPLFSACMTWLSTKSCSRQRNFHLIFLPSFFPFHSIPSLGKRTANLIENSKGLKSRSKEGEKMVGAKIKISQAEGREKKRERVKHRSDLIDTSTAILLGVELYLMLSWMLYTYQLKMLLKHWVMII